MKYTHEDGTPFTKEKFLQKLKTDKEFNDEFGNKGIDQIQNSINLLKTDPDSRRNIVSAWNVGELDKMVLPPCHNFFQFYTRELSFQERFDLCLKHPNLDPVDFGIGKHESKEHEIEHHIKVIDAYHIPKRTISLMWNQRSVDTFLGLPFNIASYGLLLEMIAKEVNMIPDELIGNLGDVHLYKNHIEQAKEQITREPMDLPKVLINNGDVDNNGTPFTKSILDGYDITDFELVNYKSHPPIKAPLSN
jgi:thymidylate synthase